MSSSPAIRLARLAVVVALLATPMSWTSTTAAAERVQPPAAQKRVVRVVLRIDGSYGGTMAGGCAQRCQQVLDLVRDSIVEALHDEAGFVDWRATGTAADTLELTWSYQGESPLSLAISRLAFALRGARYGASGPRREATFERWELLLNRAGSPQLSQPAVVASDWLALFPQFLRDDAMRKVVLLEIPIADAVDLASDPNGAHVALSATQLGLAPDVLPSFVAMGDLNITAPLAFSARGRLPLDVCHVSGSQGFRCGVDRLELANDTLRATRLAEIRSAGAFKVDRVHLTRFTSVPRQFRGTSSLEQP